MKWLVTLTLLWLALLPFQAQAGSSLPCHEPVAGSQASIRVIADPQLASAQPQKPCAHHGGARCHCLQACGAGSAAVLLIELPALSFASSAAAPRTQASLAPPRSSAAPLLRPPIRTL